MAEEKELPEEDTPPQDNPQDDTPEDQDDPQDNPQDNEDNDKDDDGEDEDIDPEKIEVETRTKKEEEPNDKKDIDKDDDDVDPDDEKAIDRVVSKRIAPLQKDLEHQKTVLEVDTYIASNPELKKYRNVLVKYAEHPAYSQVPVANIAAMVGSKDLQKIGAAKEREAQDKVNKSKNPGSSVRDVKGGKTDWRTASKEEFDRKLQEVKGMI